MSPEPPNPYAAHPSASAPRAFVAGEHLGPPLTKLVVQGLGKYKGIWTISLFDDRIVAHDETGAHGFETAKSDVPERLQAIAIAEQVNLTAIREKITLKLDAYSAAELRQYLGPELRTWAARQARRASQVEFAWLAGLVLLLLLSPTLFVVTISGFAAVAAIGGATVPGRWVYAWNSVRSLAALVVLAIDLVVFDSPLWLAVFGLVFAVNIGVSLKTFRFFSEPGSADRV